MSVEKDDEGQCSIPYGRWRGCLFEILHQINAKYHQVLYKWSMDLYNVGELQIRSSPYERWVNSYHHEPDNPCARWTDSNSLPVLIQTTISNHYNEIHHTWYINACRKLHCPDNLNLLEKLFKWPTVVSHSNPGWLFLLILITSWVKTVLFMPAGMADKTFSHQSKNIFHKKVFPSKQKYIS